MQCVEKLLLPGRPPVVDVLGAEDEEVAEELDAVADHAEEHDDLVHHGAARRPHVGQVHAVVVVPQLVGVQEYLKTQLSYRARLKGGPQVA